MTWQTIDTAPKDGTIIHLYIPGHPELEGMKGRWSDYKQDWEPYPQRLTLGQSEDVPDPTMWMPLPQRGVRS